MRVWFKITNITHALAVPVYSHPDFTPKRLVISRLHDTAARFSTGVKFSPRTTTGVNSRPGDSRRHDILRWYHVNKYRAMRGNRIEWTRAGAKVAPVSCKHPLIVVKFTLQSVFRNSRQNPRARSQGVTWAVFYSLIWLANIKTKCFTSRKSFCRSGSQTLFFGGREATTGNTSAVRRLRKSRKEEQTLTERLFNYN